MRIYWVVGIFIALVVLLAIGLSLNPREVPSPLIGKAAPRFELPLLHEPDKTFSPKSLLGRVWMLNIWASWCPPCLLEHPIITELAETRAAPIVGLNYKDARDDALAWLRRNGDPFLVSVADPHGRIAIEYGVYGVPETYVIDKRHDSIQAYRPAHARDRAGKDPAPAREAQRGGIDPSLVRPECGDGPKPLRQYSCAKLRPSLA